MKKLNKKMHIAENTVEAYLQCGCGNCYCYDSHEAGRSRGSEKGDSTMRSQGGSNFGYNVVGSR